ncbi:MAG TPA: hypothetical protein VN718_07640 [Rhizomicrobium sp.]|jgi:hypothetical protein|nr:hypothetical protein [Rhizomicrobium sp.]
MMLTGHFYADGGRQMGRKHPSGLYWVCTLISGCIIILGAWAARTAGSYDFWALGGAVVIAIVVWIVAFLAG